MHYPEDNNYPKALLYSSFVMGLFLLISYYIIISKPFTPEEEIGTGGIIVNYGTSETGMGTDYMSVEEPSVAPKANNTPPDKVVPNTDPVKAPTAETSDKSVVTQDVEDAPTVVTKEKSKPNIAPTTTTPVKESKPAVNQNALYKGNKNNGSGKGDGTGTTPGNQGSKDGDPLSPNYGKGGSGFGGVSLSLENRSFVSIPRIEDEGQSAGKIAVEIRVDKSGEVVYARAGARGTTLSDTKLWRKCEGAVLGARLNELESAPDVQTGVVMFNFKVK